MTSLTLEDNKTEYLKDKKWKKWRNSFIEINVWKLATSNKFSTIASLTCEITQLCSMLVTCNQKYPIFFWKKKFHLYVIYSWWWRWPHLSNETENLTRQYKVKLLCSQANEKIDYLYCFLKDFDHMPNRRALSQFFLTDERWRKTYVGKVCDANLTLYLLVKVAESSLVLHHQVHNLVWTKNLSLSHAN